MMEKVIRTYCVHLPTDPFLEKLSREAGDVYSKSLNEFWRVFKDEGRWMSTYDLQKQMKGLVEKNHLHSDSFLAALQQVHKNLATAKEAQKANPKIKYPYKEKEMQPIFLKESQIRIKDGQLVFSLGRDENQKMVHLTMNWTEDLPLPRFGSFSYDPGTGWKVNLSLEFERETNIPLDIKRTIGIDLGSKRIAAMFDGDQTVIFSGKKQREIIHYQTKMQERQRARMLNKKPGSKREQKAKEANQRANQKVENIKQDFCHKTSRTIVDYAEENLVATVRIGDCSGVHDKTNIGNKNNLMVQQGVEMIVAHQIQEKFRGITSLEGEAYSTQTCPCCGTKNKPSTRLYVCKSCNLQMDREQVAAVNIHGQLPREVDPETNLISFGGNFKTSERNRLLARPLYVKFSKRARYEALIVKSDFGIKCVDETCNHSDNITGQIR